MCLYPRLMLNKKYQSNKKNKGIIPKIKDKRTQYVPVKCGQCMECKKQKAREWQVRLSEEIRHDKRGRFMTMTFSDEELHKLEEEQNKHKIKKSIRKTITLPNGKKRNYYNYEIIDRPTKLKGYALDNAAAKHGVRKFLERWRKKEGTSVKHWLITELGHEGTERIHIHGLLFTNKPLEEIEQIWKYGWVDDGQKSIEGKGYVNEKTINYIIKYISKQDKTHPNYTPKLLTSDGIGKEYLKRIDAKNNKYNEKKTTEHYKTRQGQKINMPIYYRNEIYTEEEREKLWIEKLNKQERWINGVKIDVSTEKGKEIYYTRLEEERKKNKRLGYGNLEKDWDKIKYENQLRQIRAWERKIKVQNMDTVKK